MEHTLIFNHIPRTGGTTLRVILNKIYGEERVFFINSRDIPSSLSRFKSLNDVERKKYKVISGHGANEYTGLVDRPFRITILREPVSLFISQYYYLSKSHNSNFLDDVSSLQSLDQYIDYALDHGQDNMMTRLLDQTNKQLYEPHKPAPNLNTDGDKMLDNARNQLSKYDVIIDLDDFSKGIYTLAKDLSWNRIPLYRPQNKNKWDRKLLNDDPVLKKKLLKVLRFDLELYNFFLQNNHAISTPSNTRSLGYKLFSGRQEIIRMIDRFMR